ncbi:hypothetical protein [uncultured Leclercia sp.]|uniref:hypothetical protein n=1 Tax=uncultured Leclercia sp. TaxID=332959 RepID=UPI001BA804B3|nr:hypothetical protein [uncultured Leclercia sp.]EIQ7173741.1 hypothetical protein [Escherichia coli]EIQ9905324.1 hypothetical protein [Escherichia coli]MBS0854354.1 hypothetical protein [Enterobacter sp. JGM127]
MFRLTCIDLDSGEFALCINGHVIASADNSHDKLFVGELHETLSRLPGVQTDRQLHTVPEEDDWNWSDVVASLLAPVPVSRCDMTVAGMMARLQAYVPDTPCMGTFWLAEDFLALDDGLTEKEVTQAMHIASDGHDAAIGFNWDTLQYAIDRVKAR